MSDKIKQLRIVGDLKDRHTGVILIRNEISPISFYRVLVISKNFIVDVSLY